MHTGTKRDKQPARSREDCDTSRSFKIQDCVRLQDPSRFLTIPQSLKTATKSFAPRSLEDCVKIPPAVPKDCEHVHDINHSRSQGLRTSRSQRTAQQSRHSQVITNCAPSRRSHHRCNPPEASSESPATHRRPAGDASYEVVQKLPWAAVQAPSQRKMRKRSSRQMNFHCPTTNSPEPHDAAEWHDEQQHGASRLVSRGVSLPAFPCAFGSRRACIHSSHGATRDCETLAIPQVAFAWASACPH